MRHLRSDYDSIQPAPGTTSFEDDEPVFVLRAKDPSAPVAVATWAEDNAARGGDPELVTRVLAWAQEMADWKAKHHPDKKVADTPSHLLRPLPQ